MNFDEYCKLRSRTEAPVNNGIIERMIEKAEEIHMLFGMVTEIGELFDAYKRHIFYGKELDVTNLVEESGDLMWYYGGFVTHVGMSQNVILDKNIQKLEVRYPEKFTEEQAIIRNLDEERRKLEGGDQ